MLLAQRPRDRFAAFPKKFNVAEIHGQSTPKGVGSAKSLIVDRTHLVLVSDKLVLQKNLRRPECYTTLIQSIFFVVLACQKPELNGFDEHFQATVHFPLTSAVD